MGLKSVNHSFIRFGYGYDVHRLVPGRKLILGGVEILHERGLEGHSDADVLLHAIMDALLGGSALGDIGTHFPNDDPQYKGISSLLLLERVGALLAQRKLSVENIDATVVLDVPKISPYVERMRSNIAAALQISVDRVSVKATTGEGLGFIGAQEGTAAHAVASLSQQ